MIEISVIIPTHNRAKYLKGALESLLGQSLDKNKYEIIVVDNGSTDTTKNVVDELNTTGQHKIRYVYESRPGLHNGRHAGMRAAFGKILSYVDDDIIAFPDWLDHVLKCFYKDPSIVLVGGKSIPKYECAPPKWIESMWVRNKYGSVNGWLSLVDLGDDEKVIPAGYVFGCNFSIKKEVLEICKGFHPDGVPWELRKYRGDGESYVSQYIDNEKLLAYYHPYASIYHRIPAVRLTKKYFVKRASLFAIEASYSVTRYNPDLFRRLLVIMRILKNLMANTLKSLIKLDTMKLHYLYYAYTMIWHQCLIINDPDLRVWIKKECYLD